MLDNLTQEGNQLANRANNDTKHKLNSNKGVITITSQRSSRSWIMKSQIYQRIRGNYK